MGLNMFLQDLSAVEKSTPEHRLSSPSDLQLNRAYEIEEETKVRGESRKKLKLNSSFSASIPDFANAPITSTTPDVKSAKRFKSWEDFKQCKLIGEGASGKVYRAYYDENKQAGSDDRSASFSS
jgi:hypothetical protein